jgi:Fe-S cluster biogenesis protein NfuA
MIQTETTPNPDSLKFISEKTISSIGTEEFQKDKINEVSNLFIKELLGFNGVELILLAKNFLSVKKNKDVTWSELKPMVISHLNDYFEKNNEPILKDDNIQRNKASSSNETINKIIEVLDTKVRPAVARDGGDIKFKSFENGVVKVELQGSCSGCPSSLMTLKQGVQNLLKHYVKEVNSVEAISYEK